MKKFWSLPSDEHALFISELIAFYDRGTETVFNSDYIISVFSSAAQKLIQLEKLSQKWGAQKLKPETLKVFRSESIRKAVVLYAHFKRNKKIWKAQDDYLTLAIFHDRVSAMCNLENQSEKIKHQPKLKNDGSFRNIWSFGAVRHAQQYALTWILLTQISNCSYDFCLNGQNGIHSAANQIGFHSIHGQIFWAVADIKSAFPSIRKKHLRKMVSLHGKLIDYVAFPSLPYNINMVMPYKVDPQPELPQGAVHSSLVLSALIDGCLKELGSTSPSGNAIVPVVYADNFAIGCRTIEDAEWTLKALQKALTAQTAGGLTLHELEIRDASKHSGAGMSKNGIYYGHAVNFCGYRISRRIEASYRCRPSVKAFKKFWRKIELNPEIMSANYDPAWDKTAKEVKKWAKNFPLWKLREGSWNSLEISFQATYSGDQIYNGPKVSNLTDCN